MLSCSGKARSKTEVQRFVRSWSTELEETGNKETASIENGRAFTRIRVNELLVKHSAPIRTDRIAELTSSTLPTRINESCVRFDVSINFNSAFTPTCDIENEHTGAGISCTFPLDCEVMSTSTIRLVNEDEDKIAEVAVSR